jgi:hypothetical protein
MAHRVILRDRAPPGARLLLFTRARDPDNATMLSAATLGLAAYGLYSAAFGAVDLFRSPGLDWWADAALILLGLVLLLSSALVRVRMPGGLALALSMLLALQALSLHNDFHFYGAILVLPQAARGVVACALAALAYVGGKADQPTSTLRGPSGARRPRN